MLPVKLHHLQRLTDDTGLLEHCFGKVPRRKEGYSTDDNARALWACMEWLRYARAGEDAEISVLMDLADRYLAFLMWVQDEAGWFHNNVRFDRSFEPEERSDDCQGRSLWALAVTAVMHPDESRAEPARAMCRQGFRVAEELRFPRGLAHTLAAACALLLGTETMVDHHAFRTWVQEELRPLALRITEQLCQSYETHRQPEWRWFEARMTYGNGVLPWSLYWAHQTLGHTRALAIAEDALAFLVERMTSEKGCLRPIGNRSWATPEQTSAWDQQPLEMMKLALACAKAWEVTRNDEYCSLLERCVRWFEGDNDLGVPVADVKDGGCCDGLREDGLNQNQGAESTLSYLLTQAIYHNARHGGGRYE
ncbi:glycosyl transferase [Alicyclobacillus contaminans]|nr:glycosyl transferase [Alicyclobacillus contaminans]